MDKKKSFYSLVFTTFFMLLSLPLLAWDSCDNCCNPCEDSGWGITAEARVAYYHPSSKRVRRIYGDGWADYQLEISKGFKGFGDLFGNGDCGCFNINDFEWRLWAGVSGFSRKGESIGFHDDTRLQLIPVSFGVKLLYPIFCNAKIFIGGAACYSFLNIRDHSRYVHEHTRREEWGGLIQSGITYNICDWAVVSAFFDYFFQRFDFHDTHYSSYRSSGYYYDDRYIERNDLNMDGYKVGVGLGVTF
jgi:outer membrane protein